MKEETGLTICVGPLLYVCDRFKSLGHHVVDMTFQVTRVGGRLMECCETLDGERVTETHFEPVGYLKRLGFGEGFIKLIDEGFPGKGSYQGDFHTLYG